jgi:hypothetical protein
MPPIKKYNLNSILEYKNYSKTLENNSIKDKTDLNNNSDILPSNTTIKSLDNYFGISEKPPSPIPEIIYNKDELSQTTKLSLSEIKNRIDNLYETELVEIFKIIKDNKEKYTTNNNGIFINICNVKPITLTEITNFLIFSEKNNKLIDKEEEERNIYRELIT